MWSLKLYRNWFKMKYSQNMRKAWRAWNRLNLININSSNYWSREEYYITNLLSQVLLRGVGGGEGDEAKWCLFSIPLLPISLINYFPSSKSHLPHAPSSLDPQFMLRCCKSPLIRVCERPPLKIIRIAKPRWVFWKFSNSHSAFIK